VIASEPESKGAIMAIFLGFVVLYNLARPVGWKNSKRPDLISEIKVGNESEKKDKAE